LFDDLRYHTFSHDSAKFNNAPVCSLTDKQAKRLIATRATQTLQETAYLLGFSEPTSFYRYFKRVTGMTAKQYRDIHS
jgi:AraC-like DNA-binding protein